MSDCVDLVQCTNHICSPVCLSARVQCKSLGAHQPRLKPLTKATPLVKPGMRRKVSGRCGSSPATGPSSSALALKLPLCSHQKHPSVDTILQLFCISSGGSTLQPMIYLYRVGANPCDDAAERCKRPTAEPTVPCSCRAAPAPPMATAPASSRPATKRTKPLTGCNVRHHSPQHAGIRCKMRCRRPDSLRYQQTMHGGRVIASQVSAPEFALTGCQSMPLKSSIGSGNTVHVCSACPVHRSTVSPDTHAGHQGLPLSHSQHAVLISTRLCV